MSEVGEGHDPRVAQILDEYLAALAAGEKPDREALLAAHPDLADVLADCLASLEFVHAAGLRSSSRDEGDRSGETIQALGSVLGDYRIMREIGRGGMGVVYEAEQHSLGRRVALKILPYAAMLDPKQVTRFQNEAHAAASLHHENIVPVYATGCERGTYFYAMQLVDGPSLADVIHGMRRDGPRGFRPRTSVADDSATAANQALEQPRSSPQRDSANRSSESGKSAEASIGPAERVASRPRSAPSQEHFRQAARIGQQVADALHHAHELGVIHRDIKPSNLLLDRKGKVWVTDFGLALLPGEARLTVSGDLLGTLRYMSPEQALAKRIPVDQRTDIYSLGVTLYELITFEPAFVGEDRQDLLRQIAFEEPVVLRRLVRSVPRDLETIVLKAMAKNPSHRYASARDMAEDLKAFLEDRPIQARRPNPIERVARWARRHRAVVATVSLFSLLLLIVSVGLICWSSIVFRAQRDEALALRRLAEDRLIRARLAQAASGRISSWAGQKIDGLEAAREAAQLAVRRNMTSAQRLHLRNEVVASLCFEIDLQLEHSRSFDTWSFWNIFDPNMEVYCRSEGNEGAVTLYRAADDRLIAELPGDGHPPGRMQFSPDGRWLAVRYSNSRVTIWDWPTARPLGSFVSPTVRGMDLDPKGKQVAIARTRGVVFREIGEADHRGPPALLVDDPREIAYSPDGALLAVASGREVQIWDVAGRSLLFSLPHEANVFEVAWRPDGQQLATSTDDYRAFLWDLRERHLASELTGHHGRLTRFCYSHSGKLLAGRTFDGTTSVWDPDSGRLRLQTHGRIDRFGKEDTRVAISNSYRYDMWRVVRRRDSRLLPIAGSHEELILGPYALDFDPQTGLLVVASAAGPMVWNPETGECVAHCPEVGPTQSVCFLATDGALLSSGHRGVWRWPCAKDAQNGMIHFGPPELVADKTTERGNMRPALLPGADRRWIGIANTDEEGRLLDPLHPDRAILVTGQTALWSIAADPDVRWVVTGGLRQVHNVGLRLWERAGDRLTPASDLWPNVSSTWVAFSSDGKWLAANAAPECRVWHAGDWSQYWRLPCEAVNDIPRAVAFSPDSRVLAYCPVASQIRLVDLESRSELVSLPLPDSHFSLAGLVFSPDGGWLAARVDDGVRLWDLRRIRGELAALQLDWPGPPIPAPAPEAARNWQVTFDPSTLPPNAGGGEEGP